MGAAVDLGVEFRFCAGFRFAGGFFGVTLTILLSVDGPLLDPLGRPIFRFGGGFGFALFFSIFGSFAMRCKKVPKFSTES